MLRGRSGASWAVLATGLATALLVSPAATRSPLRSLGLSIGKPVAMAAGALLCAVVCALAWRGRRLAMSGVEWAAMGYLGCGLLSMMVNGVQGPFVLPWLAMQLGGLVVMATAASAAGDGARGWLTDGTVMIAATIAAIAIYEAAGGELWWDAPRRPGATFGNRNAVGGFCAIALPLAVARIWEQQRLGMVQNLWRGSALATLVLAVLLCRARSSWLALLLVSAAVVGVGAARWQRQRGRQRPKAGQEADPLAPARHARTGRIELGEPNAQNGEPQRQTMIVIAAAVAAAALTMAFAPWQLAWKEDSPLAASFSRLIDYESGTGKSRVEQHQVGMRMVAEQPIFGFGPGTWRREAPRFAHAAPGQHAAFIAPLWTPASDLLRHLVETGFAGAAAALAMIALLFRGGWRRLQRGAHAMHGTTLAPMASLAVALIISGFDALLARPASLVLVATIAGLLRAEGEDGEARNEANLSSTANHARPSGGATKRVPGWICGGAMIAAAMFALLVFLPRYLAAQHFAEDFSPRTVLATDGVSFLPYEAAQAMAVRRRASDCEMGERAAKLVLSYLPNEPRLLQLVARCAERRANWREAAELWRRSLEIEPHDEEAQKAQQRALVR